MNHLYIFFKTCFLGFMKNLVIIIRSGVSNKEDIYWVSKKNLLHICVKLLRFVSTHLVYINYFVNI